MPMDTGRGEKSLAVGRAGQREEPLDGGSFPGGRLESAGGRPGPEHRKGHLQEGVKGGDEYREQARGVLRRWGQPWKPLQAPGVYESGAWQRGTV